MMGLRGEDGRWIQDDGEIDIQCISAPFVVVESDLATITLTFYTNNEPHLNLTTFKSSSIEVMKFTKRAVKGIKAKLHELGYDKVYVLIAEGDEDAVKKIEWLGFIPKLVYDTPFGLRYVKYEMETK